MTQRQILLDSGFVYALLDKAQPDHKNVRAALQSAKAQPLVPDVTLTETAFLFNRTGGVPAVLRFLDAFVAMKLTLQPVIPEDLTRARQIMAAYPQARLDFLDCCIMALSQSVSILIQSVRLTAAIL